MSYSVIAHTIAAGVTTSAIDTTGADIIFVGIIDGFGGTFTLTDSKSNTWTPLTRQLSSVADVQIFYAKNATVGSGHTFSWSGSGDFSTMAVLACSGSNTTTPFDQENGAHQESGTSEQTGSVTPGADNEILIAIAGTNGSPTWAIDSGFTISDSIANIGSNFAGAMAYLIQTTAAAKNPSWSGWADGYSAVAIATFKAAAGGGLSVAQEMGGIASSGGDMVGQMYSRGREHRHGSLSLR